MPNIDKVIKLIALIMLVAMLAACGAPASATEAPMEAPAATEAPMEAPAAANTSTAEPTAVPELVYAVYVDAGETFQNYEAWNAPADVCDRPQQYNLFNYSDSIVELRLTKSGDVVRVRPYDANNSVFELVSNAIPSVSGNAYTLYATKMDGNDEITMVWNAVFCPGKNEGDKAMVYYGNTYSTVSYDGAPTYTPTYTPTPTFTPSYTPTMSPTITPSYTPTSTLTNTPTITPTSLPLQVIIPTTDG